MSAIPARPTAAAPWRPALWQLALVLGAVLGLFQATAGSMVWIWLRSETFAHGFLILPISLWLIWDRRAALRLLAPARQPGGLWLFGLAGALWLAAVLAQALVVEQSALIAMLIAAVWAMLGDRVTRAMLFPLLFLFFSVPVGEDLVPPMMEFTASFTVGLLRFTGIPVYREGLFFSIPSGNWSVVEACSGVRYLIAAVTLGCLYAYLTYRSLWKRIAFVLISILVPIVANGLRAYLIVMIAHWSDYRLAVGVDHLIYGWLFFGLVMLVLFAVGAIWREDGSPGQAPETRADAAGAGPLSLRAPILLVLLAGLWSGLGWAVQREGSGTAAGTLAAPQALGAWSLGALPAWGWRPQTPGADGRIDAFYARDSEAVSLHLAQYNRSRQGAEAVNSANVMVAEATRTWRELSAGRRTVSIRSEPLGVIESQISGPEGNLLVWHWYRIGDHYVTSPYLAKAIEALSRLSFGRRDTALLAVATLDTGEADRARARLAAFLGDALGPLEREMERAAAIDRPGGGDQ